MALLGHRQISGATNRLYTSDFGNGTIVVVGGTTDNIITSKTSQTTLTLTDATDLKYFRQGDVVQSNADPTNIATGDTVDIRISGTGDDQIDISWANATVAETLTLFNVQNNGDKNTFPGNQTATSFLYKFNKPAYGLEFMGENEISNNADFWVLSGSSDGITWTEVVRNNNLNSPSSTRDGFLKMGSTPYLYWKVSHVTPTGAASAMGYWFYGWKVYDTIEEVKVISTGYPDSNTMVVDGGNWDVSNQSQVWSSAWREVPGVGRDDTVQFPKNAFDGDLTTYTSRSVGSMNGSAPWAFKLDFSAAGINLPYNDKVEIYISCDPSSLPTRVKLNSETAIDFTDGDGWKTLTEGTSGIISQIQMEITDTWLGSTAGPRVYGLRVDGKLLVDAVNDSQVWSANATKGNAKPAFNGVIDSVSWSGNSDAEIVFDTPVPFNKVEVIGAAVNISDIRINHTNVDVKSGSTSNLIWADVTSTLTSAGHTQVESIYLATSSAAFQAIKIDGKLLVDTGVSRGLGDTEVTGPALGATGKFSSANGDTATVTDVTGRWVGANDQGKSFYMEPTVPQIDQVSEMFCNLEIGTLNVQSLTPSDPGFVGLVSKDSSVKFGNQFPSGETPDDALPKGTQIEVTVKATNDLGSDEKTSNAVTPLAPNPEGSAGPITGVSADGNTLTVANSQYLNTFFKADNARDEADYQAIADAFAAYPGKVDARKADITAAVIKAAASLSDTEAALLYEITGVETPPDLQDLIPDNWTQEQRRAAMEELIKEYRAMYDQEESN